MRLKHFFLIAGFSPMLLQAQIKPNNATYPPATYNPPVTPPTNYDAIANFKVNYIRTWEAMQPVENPTETDLSNQTKYKQATAYFDGLGRPLQEVVKGASPDGLKDLVSMHTYDAFGREAINYLPYPAIPNATDGGKFKTNPFAATQAYYNTNYTDQRPYALTEFEPSPLNRPTKTMAPGNSWVGSNKGIGKQYLLNTLADDVRIWNTNYDAISDNNNIPTSTASYLAGALYKNVTIDEHNKQVVEYTDKEGHVILKKVQLADNPGASHTGWLCTYYVYDDFGLLRFVMQPKAVEQLAGPANWQLQTDVVAELCFRYEYDSRQRMIAKKVPGAGWVYMAYDKRDRLVYTQDANTRVSGKWLTTFYDVLNRPVSTALYSSTATMDALQTQLNGITADNPVPTIAEASLERLTYTYYDDYTFAGSASFDNSQLSTTQTNYQLIDEVADNTVKTTATRGLVTGTWVKVLGSNPEKWIKNTTYYDTKGRPLQAISTNFKTGTDIVTTQYSFTGKVISTVSKHNNPAATLVNTQTTTIQQTTLYQNNFAISTRQRITGAGANSGEWKTISTLQYDDMGKTERKEMGNGYTLDGNPEKFFTNFSYNIRGWLTGINKTDYEGLSPVFGGQFYTPIFSQKLSYDFGFANSAQLNGNISGIQWTHAGDKMKRAFGYEYDAANRLKKAEFNQNENGTWTNATINYNVSNLSYDANGNILTMTQYGLKLGSSSVVDDLVYKYKNNELSNRLRNVHDNLDDPSFKLGDFKDGTNGQSTTVDDYNYDLNGSLQYDKNKDIQSIAYNYLNLPQTITVLNKGTITYTYDATGNKLTKIVNQTTPATITTTDYLGAFQYQNNELQQAGHAEGRVRYSKRQTIDGQTADYYWNYDYFYKDHLGNIRTTVTEQGDVYLYQATLENAKIQDEELSFNDLYNTRKIISEISGYPSQPNNIFTSKVNGTANSGIGPNIVLKVMAGDRYDLSCISWYRYLGQGLDNQVEPWSNPLSQILFKGLVPLISGQIAATSVHNGTLLNQDFVNTLSPAVEFFLNTQGNDYVANGDPQKPKAYINWMLFDEQFKPVDGPDGSGFEAVGASEEYKQHVFLNLPIVKSGYFYVWVSNETNNVNVYFDNLTVVHRTGPLLQEDDYYPFGLEMKMLGSKAAGKLQNKLGITSKEKQDNEFADGTGLEWYDFGARMQDPQIGRWFNVDPMADKYSNWSTYTYCLNNPVITIDPDGRSTHTDRSGNVLGVYDDDDEGVYSHGKKELKKWDQKSVLSSDSKGVRKEGETEFWDEFGQHDENNNVVSKDGTNFANTKAKINFGANIDDLFKGLQSSVADKLRRFDNGTKALSWLKNNSGLNALLDLKKYLGAEKGFLLNGKYVSGESLGNIFFGMNLDVVRTESPSAAGVNILVGTGNGFKIDFWTVTMMAAGAYHNYSNTANNPAIAPYYGETNYTGRRVAQGYFGGGGPILPLVLSIIPSSAINSTKIKK